MQDYIRKQKEITAEKIMRQVQEQLIAYMPFMNRAILKMPIEFFETKEDVDDLEEAPTADYFATDGLKIFCDPDYVIAKFKDNTANLPRMYMHMIFHCIFFHPFQYDKLNFELWDYASDIAVENTIIDLKLKDLQLPLDIERKRAIERLKQKVNVFTAENIYSFLLSDSKEASLELKNANLFKEDDHQLWVSVDHLVGKQRMSNRSDLDGRNNYALEEWKQEGKTIQLNVESISRYRERLPGSAIDNIKEVFREKHDYRDFIKKFVSNKEELKINQDEFDYIYYTYGMKLYGNLPLIEPLEYCDTKKIHDFVIAIDTSGSCQGRVVRSFLNKTYTILKDTNCFTDNMNLHILQCDSKVQSAIKLTNLHEFEGYLDNIDVKGFGGTDFRPVFEYVDKQLKSKEFHDFRGLLYLTDGNGIYPKAVSEYPTAFIIVEDPKEKPKVPSWIIKLIMPLEEFSKDNLMYY